MKIEFRIKQDSIKWEQNEPYITKEYEDNNISSIHKDAKEIANKLNKEIRWNYYGELNGKYVRPNFK
ncbi:hypothetical protein AAXE64_08325 [Priestia megaterium]